MNFYVDGNNAGTVPSVRQVSFHSGLSLAQTRNFAGTRTYQGIASVEFYLPTLSRPGSISPTYLRTAFWLVAPKSIRIQSNCLYLLRFWDLRVQKLG